MLLNYFKVAWRALLKNSVYSFINIAGLSIGIACAILIGLWVHNELTYDHFHPKFERLHQAWIHAEYDGQLTSMTSMPMPLYEKLKTAHAGIKNVSVTNRGGYHLINFGTKGVMKGGFFVSKEFLDMFQFPLVQGDVKEVFALPNSIVITESTAKAIFGNADPMNQVLRIDNKDDVKVTGILKDLPGNSSLEFDFLAPFALYHWDVVEQDPMNNWGNYSYAVYVETTTNDDHTAISASLRNVINENTKDGIPREFFLYPMSRWRLHSSFSNGVEAGGLVEYVNVFTGVAMFIVLIACINFMNLATARSEKRAREVGIRKCIGSQRRELIWQFLGESVAMTFIAYCIAILLCLLVMPLYNNMVSKQLSIDFMSLKFWLASIGLVLGTGILAGSYPAFFLSSFQAVKVLKGNTLQGNRGSLPRKILVTFQFVFSIISVISVIGIYKQISHVKSRDLGYERKNLIYVDTNADMMKNYRVIKNELLESGVATAVTQSNSPITNIYSNNFIRWPGLPDGENMMMATITSGYDYTETMGLKLVQGRDFSEEFPTDSANSIIVNQAAVDVMGLDDPIGTELELWGGKRKIIGVMNDALMTSPFRDPAPTFLIFLPAYVSAVTIRMSDTEDMKAQLEQIATIFKKYNPEYPLNYHFVDQEFDKKFASIDLIETLTDLFAGLALVITGLGLFGLASFTAERRTKEIGIRKVLGASLSSIVKLISRDFSVLIIVAFVIATPIGYYYMDDYLSRYAYRTELNWWIFPVIGLAVFAISFAIVATQALRAGMSNPVEALRSE